MPLNRDAFCESLLRAMERKDHWAWSGFNTGLVPKDKLNIHFEQEFATYVRDFPVFVGWAYVQCPDAQVRQALAENLYEEETGGLVAGKPHPQLFLEYPRGLGMDLQRFDSITLLPAAQAYRQALDTMTQKRGWAVAAAVVTIFIEGTRDERGEVDGTAAKRVAPPLEEHPLVRHYGLGLQHLALTKAHRQVEGNHRAAAWHSILNHVTEADRGPVVDAMEAAVTAWLAYRDDVATACGLRRGADGKPQLAR